MNVQYFLNRKRANCRRCVEQSSYAITLNRLQQKREVLEKQKLRDRIQHTATKK